MSSANNVGYLKVIIGSMFSGKTTELFREHRRYSSCGFECLLINHSSDKRYTDNEETSSHDGFLVNSINIGDKLFDFFKKESYLTRYDVIFINEGQFFEDLYKFVDDVVNQKNKRVYVCGLDGDFKREKFGTLLNIIPICDDIIKLKALCIQCKKSEAIFTFRLTNDQEQTVVGGTESYCALCRNCYNNSFYQDKNCV